MNKKILYLQTFVLAGGVLFSWSVLVRNFMNFYDTYGTLFRFQDCAIPNPIATPCFYGSVAFLVALIWSISLTISVEPSQASQKWLGRLLLFGVVFAFSVVGYETVQYYNLLGGPIISCSPGSAPWNGPCFIGAIFFVGAYITSRFVQKSNFN